MRDRECEVATVVVLAHYLRSPSVEQKNDRKVWTDFKPIWPGGLGTKDRCWPLTLAFVD